MNIMATFDWINAGNLTVTGDNKIVFPFLPESPGIYRFHCLTQIDPWLYIGEADNLKTRMSSYGKPGPTQGTNIRLNALFRSALEEDQRITLETVTAATLEVDNSRVAANLSDVFVRRLVEDAAIVAAVIAGMRILNKRRSKYVAD